jgi:hypothetical protein
MRVLGVSLTSAFLLAGSMALAQPLPSSSVRQDCPPGEPDSVQISWTEPCESGSWLLDTEAGCRMWDWHPAPEDKAEWSGACRAGLPEGRGTAQWYEHGRPIDRFIGTYRNGKRVGEGQYVWNDGVRFDGTYADDVPNGRGVFKLEGDVFAGDWKDGCFARNDGRVVAIGVPRASCQAGDGAPGQRKKVAENPGSSTAQSQ